MIRDTILKTHVADGDTEPKGARATRRETKASVSWHSGAVKRSESQGGKGAVVNRREKLRVHAERERAVFCIRTLLFTSPLGELIFMRGI